MYCKYCQKTKKLNDFYDSRPKKCKECVKVDVKSNRGENSDYYKEYDRKRFKEDPKVRERHRRYQKSEVGKDSQKRSSKKWRENNAVKRAAHILVGNRLRDGTITKLNYCEDCGCDDKRLNGHHDDYTKPLEVRWLCCLCHTKWHRENGEGFF